MPTDESQREHAARIHFRREFSRALGISPRDAGRMLDKFNEQVRNDSLRPAVQLAPDGPTPRPKGAPIQDGPPQQLRQGGFINGVGQQGNGKAAGGIAVGDTLPLTYVMINGTRYTVTLLLDGPPVEA